MLAEILHDFASNFRTVYTIQQSPAETLEAYKITIGRANDIKKP
jgi:hypothetical protein